MSLLHILIRLNTPQPGFCVIGVSRFVKLLNRWFFILLVAPGVTEIKVTDTQIISRVEELIDDDSVKLKLKRVFKWTTYESNALQYSHAHKVFCIDDADHGDIYLKASLAQTPASKISTTSPGSYPTSFSNAWSRLYSLSLSENKSCTAPTTYAACTRHFSPPLAPSNRRSKTAF